MRRFRCLVVARSLALTKEARGEAAKTNSANCIRISLSQYVGLLVESAGDAAT